MSLTISTKSSMALFILDWASSIDDNLASILRFSCDDVVGDGGKGMFSAVGALFDSPLVPIDGI